MIERGRRVLLALALATLGGSCSEPPAWMAAQSDLPGALLSVWGTTANDVFSVGADVRDGSGPIIIHYDGTRWTRIRTAQTSGDLWWVAGVGDQAVFAVGTQGVILRYDRTTEQVTRMSTPGTGTIFGIWGASEADIWAVGGDSAAVDPQPRGFIWHYDGSAWTNATVPLAAVQTSSLFKVWGSAANDIWAVGGLSTTLHWDGTAWEVRPTDTPGQRLLTVHGSGQYRVAVGGVGTGVILEASGNGWAAVPGNSFPGINGVHALASGEAFAVGDVGVVLHRDMAGHWSEFGSQPGASFDFHAVWVDPSGGVWAAGGQFVSQPMLNGMLWHYGPRVASGVDLAR